MHSHSPMHSPAAVPPHFVWLCHNNMNNAHAQSTQSAHAAVMRGSMNTAAASSSPRHAGRRASLGADCDVAAAVRRDRCYEAQRAQIPPHCRATQPNEYIVDGDRHGASSNDDAPFPSLHHARPSNGSLEHEAIPCFHPGCSSSTAADILGAACTGAYLIRAGRSHSGVSLTLRGCTGIKHYAIKKGPGLWEMANSQPRQFQRLEALLEYYATTPPSSREGTCLSHPVVYSVGDHCDKRRQSTQAVEWGRVSFGALSVTSTRSSTASLEDHHDQAYTQLMNTPANPEAMAAARRASQQKIQAHTAKQQRQHEQHERTIGRFFGQPGIRYVALAET